MKAKDLLKKYEACNEAIKWADEMTVQEAWEACERGDWMLWIYAKMYPDNLRELTIAKGHCSNTVRHLMKDERSINAVDAAIEFGEGKINKEILNAYASAADAAYAAAAADADYAAAKKENQKQTADICRKYLKL